MVYIPLDIPSLMEKLLETEVNSLGWGGLSFSSNNSSVSFPVLLVGWRMKGGWGGAVRPRLVCVWRPVKLGLCKMHNMGTPC